MSYKTVGSPIAYLMSRFPHLPETFILREMTELEAQGWEVALYPLIFQKQKVIHPEAQAWIPRAHTYPYISPQILAENARQLVRRPLQYIRLWNQAVWENRSSPNFLARVALLLPKSVAIARHMQANNVAHIHAHYATHPAFVAWSIHQLTGLSYSFTAHAHDIFVRTAMLPTKAREAAFIVAISEYNRQHLAKLVGDWVREKTAVIHCGIRPEDYQPHGARSPESKPFHIVNIGSLQPYKGQKYLVEACSILKARGVNFRCSIIGGGEEFTSLERQIQSAGLQSQVELAGSKTQNEVAHYLAQADCYVQPSVVTSNGKKEGIPVALMEALACGLPAVSTHVGSVDEIVQDGVSGFIVATGDENDLTEVQQKCRKVSSQSSMDE